MSPETHLLASWIIAAKTTRNPRDCRLVALAGILPDADGLGLVVDLITKATGHPTTLYADYHHFLLHGAFGAALIALGLGAFARDRWRVVLLAGLVFHLHLLADFVGSRGPTIDDLWPIYYLGPFSKNPVWLWTGQWRLDGWQNRYLSLVLMAWAILLAPKLGHSVVGVFHRRADAAVVSVFRKWKRALTGSRIWRRLIQPPWRTTVPAACLVAFAALQYVLWQPGADVRDGQHDRRRNAIWISHGWLGADAWFAQGTNQPSRFRDPDRIRELRDTLRQNHILYVFPHLCPAESNGALPETDSEQVERFLDEFERFRVLPWVGGPNGYNVRFRDPAWRATFISGIQSLLTEHNRFAGIHLNVEPLPSGDPDFLAFLDELKAALPERKLLSVAAYPPPSHWHPYPDVHWEEAYFREVSQRADQMAVMLYDTSLRVPKLYQKLVADWTREVLAWSGGKPVLLGVPAYTDAATGYHHPATENLENALLGIHGGLSDRPFIKSYEGVAIYCEWEMDRSEWALWQERFRRPPP